MTSLPLADWQASLDEMERTLAATLTALECYQAGWQQLLTERTAEGDRSTQATALDGIEVRLHDWGTRLAAAEELAASVERQLTERESAVVVWQQTFTDWRELIQRGETPQAASEAV